MRNMYVFAWRLQSIRAAPFLSQVLLGHWQKSKLRSLPRCPLLLLMRGQDLHDLFSEQHLGTDKEVVMMMMTLWCRCATHQDICSSLLSAYWQTRCSALVVSSDNDE